VYYSDLPWVTPPPFGVVTPFRVLLQNQIVNRERLTSPPEVFALYLNSFFELAERRGYLFPLGFNDCYQPQTRPLRRTHSNPTEVRKFKLSGYQFICQRTATQRGDRFRQVVSVAAGAGGGWSAGPLIKPSKTKLPTITSNWLSQPRQLGHGRGTAISG